MTLTESTLFGYTHNVVRRFMPGLLHEFSVANGWTDEQGYWVSGQLTK